MGDKVKNHKIPFPKEEPEQGEQVQIEVKTIEQPKPEFVEVKLEITPEPDPIVMSLKEFASSLKGTDLLVASAMKEFTGLRQTREAWGETLKKFGARAV